MIVINKARDFIGCFLLFVSLSIMTRKTADSIFSASIEKAINKSKRQDMDWYLESINDWTSRINEKL